MLLSLIRHLFSTLAVIVIMTASFSSAYQKAPSQDEAQKQAIALLLGISLDDFCDDSEASHDHDCPFCHKLADPALVRASAADYLLVADIDWQSGHDLVVGPQHIYPYVSTRAPPRKV